MRLYKMELYKIYHNKMFLATCIAIVSLLLFFFWFEEVGTQYSTIDGKRLEGYQAIQQDREITKEFEGILTDEKIEKIIQKYGFPKQVKEDYPGFYDANFLTAFITEYFSDGYMYDWNNYQIPTKVISLAQSELGKSENEVMLYYTRGWKILLEMLQLGMILGNIAIIIGTSRIFAEESQLQMIPLMFTAEKGKKEDTIAKIMAVFTMTFCVYVVIIVLSIALSYMVFGLDGADCLYWSVTGTHAWLNITMKEAVLMLLGVNFLGFLYLCSITLCVSAHVQSTFYAVVGATICWGLPVLVRIFFGGFAYLIICSSPVFLTQYGCVMDVWNMLMILIPFAVVGLLFCSIKGCLAYLKKQN